MHEPLNNNNNIWSATRPFSQSETDLRRAQLNEVGPKEQCCRVGARPLTTTHVWPRSTAPQPDGIGRESILRREENRSTRRKTLGVKLRSTDTQPTYDPRPELNPGHRGGRHGCQIASWWWKKMQKKPVQPNPSSVIGLMHLTQGLVASKHCLFKDWVLTFKSKLYVLSKLRTCLFLTPWIEAKCSELLKCSEITIV